MARFLAILILLIGAITPQDTQAAAGGLSLFQYGASPTSFTPAWQSLKIGGGGLLNSIQVSQSDGTMIAATNTYGAYLLRASGTCAGASSGGWGTGYSAPCWEQLFTQTSAPLTITQVAGLNQGVLEADSCNNNTNDAYAWFNGNLWVTTTLKSAASSRTWAQTTLTNSIQGNQGNSAGTARSIGCDPLNPNVVYAANTSALNRSVNGLSGASATFAAVSALPSTGVIPDLIDFDPGSSSTTCGGQTCSAHYFVFVSGTGLEETYTGGSSFTHPSCGPTSPGGSSSHYFVQMKVDKNDQVWIVAGVTTLYRYTPNGTAGGGSCSTFTPGNYNGSVEVAIDPTSSSLSATRIAVAGSDGNIALSINNGVSWTSVGTMSFASSGAQPPWLGNANQTSAGITYLDSQDLIFDTSGNLWSAAGIGAWEILSASVSVNATWQAASLGIENLVANHVDAPLGNTPIVATWDRAFWNLTNPDVLPSDYWPDYPSSHSYGPINGGWALDYASSNTNFLAGWAGQDNTVPATTSTGGYPWTIWSSVSLGTTNVGGDIAVSTPLNWVVVPAGTSGNLQYTTNGGTSFAAATTTGMTLPISAGQQHGFHIAADRVTVNTFCLIDNNEDLWASTTSGATWTKNSTGLENAGIKYNDALKAVPGQAGVFYYSGGNAGGGSTGYHLWKITKTTNECDTVADVNSNITNIFGFGYGAAKPGGNGFPTIYFYGEYNSVLGLYEIDNGGSTPALINVPTSAQTWPNNSGDFINDVSGDMNVYGRIYVGNNGSGLTYIDIQGACPWVAWNSFVPKAALTGTVTLTAAQSGLIPGSLVTSVSFILDIAGADTTIASFSGAGPYSVSWNASGVSAGSHTLTVQTSGNSCGGSGSFTFPITTSMAEPTNDNTMNCLARVA